jgi:hypothetical protein
VTWGEACVAAICAMAKRLRGRLTIAVVGLQSLIWVWVALDSNGRALDSHVGLGNSE